MEHAAQVGDTRVPNSWLTVFVATALTLGGIAGFAVGMGELGPQLSQWQSNVPNAMPMLGASVLALLSGTALGFAHRRAVLFLALGLAWYLFCSYMVQYEWAAPKSGSAHTFALLYSLYLLRNGRLGGSGPNNSSKPTPLRGAA